MRELLQKMCAVYGPSGDEALIRETVRAEIEGLVDEVRVDTLGNLIALRRPRGAATESGQKVLLAAHLDEIGIIVTHIDDNGFARFTNIGFVNANTLLGSRVVFANGVEGTFGAEGAPLPRDKVELAQLFLDVGATSRATCPVKVGDMAVFRNAFAVQGSRVFAPNLDDRVGVAVLIQLLRELDDSRHTLFAVFTVQEEIGDAGAAAAAFGVEPNLAIAIDVTAAGDTPRAKPITVRLGAGPAIGVKDVGVVTPPAVKQALADGAARAGIVVQYDVGHFGTTDAYAIQSTRTGVPSGALSVPARYIHTPSQIADMQDIQDCVALLKGLLEQEE